MPALAVQESGVPGVKGCRLQAPYPRRHVPRPLPGSKSEIRNLWDPCKMLNMEKARGVEEQLHTQGMHITASSAYKCK